MLPISSLLLSLQGFPQAEKAIPKTPFSGKKLRRRSKDGESGLIYEWDYRHGLVEVYDRHGRHLYVSIREHLA